MKQFVSTAIEAALEADGTPVEDQYTEFEVDGRILRAYQPHEGQLMLLMANVGRGQNQAVRMGTNINVILSSLRDEDRDYLEERLLETDPKKRLRPELVNDIFEFLLEEWFANPTQSSTD